MNKVQILGTITRDVEIRYTQNGSAIGSFGIAYNDKFKNASGEMVDKAHFFDITAFGKTAEVINQHFKKGNRILIDGSLDFQSWEKDGRKNSKVGIKLNGFDFIDRKSSDATPSTNNSTQNTYSQPQPTQNIPEIDVGSDEIPF